MLIDRLDNQATSDGTTRDLGADSHHASGNEARIVVFVKAARLPDYWRQSYLVVIICIEKKKKKLRYPCGWERQSSVRSCRGA